MILVSTLTWIDYKEYVRGGKSFLFVDKTEDEKEIREEQRLLRKLRIRDIKEELGE
jgi:hypothetical protein